ncbi:MAG: Tsi3 family protein [Hyphomicrobiales bacterium]
MRHVSRTVLICAVSVLPMSCSEPVEVTLLEELRHANGLVVQRPEGFDVTEKPDGFAFNEAGALRTPRSVRVMKAAKAPSAKSKGRRRLSNGAAADYAVARLNGGSGGNEYAFVAWHAVGETWLVLRARTQSEWSEPNFAVAWAVFGTARVAGPAEQ